MWGTRTGEGVGSRACGGVSSMLVRSVFGCFGLV